MSNLRLYLALGAVLAALGSCGWHKHVVHQRDDARHEAAGLHVRLAASVEATKESERLRKAEAAVARADIQAAQKTCDARVAEARRASQAIRKIVEKPRATDPQSHCPIPDRIPADELRDALQPRPFRGATEAPAR